MIEPYSAVALQTSVLNVRTRDEVSRNLMHIGNMIDLVVHICSLEMPVRLITLGEGAIQGFIDEILDLGQAEYTETMAADMPGWETEALGEWMCDVLDAPADADVLERVKSAVVEQCRRLPVYRPPS